MGEIVNTRYNSIGRSYATPHMHAGTHFKALDQDNNISMFGAATLSLGEAMSLQSQATFSSQMIFLAILQPALRPIWLRYSSNIFRPLFHMYELCKEGLMPWSQLNI